LAKQLGDPSNRQAAGYVEHQLEFLIVTHFQAKAIHLQKCERDDERETLVAVDECLILRDSP